MTDSERNGTPLYLNAREAAAELGVSQATLYAYVSRGLIQSEGEGGRRGKRYRADDVRALKERREPDREKEGASLAWGAPVLDSAITLIADGRLFYRGADAAELARTTRLEGLAAMLWGCRGSDPFALPLPELPPVARDLLEVDLAPVARAQAILPLAMAVDRAAYNTTPEGLAATGARILRLIVGAIAGRAPCAEPAHEVLAGAWGTHAAPAPQIISAALVLCADHELNASAFTARCIASTRATPYGAVIGALAALQGPRHGGMSSLAEGLIDSLVGARDVDSAVMERLHLGERLPGFGHPLYPDIDPRAKVLIDLVKRAFAQEQRVMRAVRIADVVRGAAGLHANLDFGLALVRHALNLPKGAGIAMFAAGRTAGWIAHAIEQHARPELIRPRARYTGPVPRGIANV